MKKLHLISAMYASKGHGHEYIRNFCSQLHNEYDITLHVASKDKVFKPENIKINYTNIEYKKTDAENFNKYSYFAPYFRALKKQYYSHLFYKKIISSNFIKKDDLIYIMDYDVLPLSIFLVKLKKTGIHNVFLWIHSAKFKSKDLLYRAYKWIFIKSFNKILIGKIKAIVVNGEYIKKEIVKNLKISEDKVNVIQYPSEILFTKNSKEESRKQLGFDSKDQIILFFGMLRTDKNLEYTIKSISKTKTKPKLIIAGSEASVTKADLEYWIKKHGLTNFFLDINYITEEKMALYYNCSDLLILTYELESGSQSGPLSLAREFELPALVTDTGEIGEYVKENNVGMVANFEGKNSFPNKIDEFFLQHNSETKKLNNALKFAKNKFSWSSAKSKYVKLFNE